MKMFNNIIKNKPIAILISAMAILTTACEVDIPYYMNYDSYDYTSEDENGGTWSHILPTASEITIAAPSAPNSSEYLAEIANMKSAMQQINGQQKKAIEYWTNNPIIRWNEIAVELISKYNLIPGPNADGTYTLPSAANPNGPPPFPFANPPYAIRALAYLSVAQYDGLISAWNFKYAYNRAAPYQQDNTITFAYPANTIPSYPSDGAVIASASRRILSAMFPLEVAYLQQKEDEHLESLLLSGGTVQSDIDAGKLIGNEIATRALARASTDGMSKAQTPKPVSDSIKAAAFARFGWQWTNQETPTRPVGLTPLYGKVRMWNVANVASVRPGPPPAIGSAEYLEDVRILKDYAANVTTERRRIANFWSDGLSTFTPPGHWNRITKEYLVEYEFNPLRSARTFAYLNMAIMDAGISCWDAKYYYHYPRPIEMIDGFKTIIGTPNFPAYTSGHSTFSAAAAEVLSYVFPDESDQVWKWAEEAANSRLYGGIHWTFDARVGLEQGKNVAEYSVERAKLDGAD
jgi:PAP2 superfamily